MEQQQQEAGAHSLWRHLNFRRLWISETVSQFGGQFSGWAIPTIAAYVLGASPLQLGILGAMGMLAWPLFALPIGVWVDQRRRKPVMVLANIGRATALAIVPVAWLLGLKTSQFGFNPFNINTLYIVSFAVGLLTIFFDVSYQSLLPSIVESDQLVDGNSKLQISKSTAQAIGPTIATAAIQLITIPASPLACVGDAVGFSASAYFLGRIDREEKVTVDDSRNNSLLEQMKEGLRIVLYNPTLRSIAAASATFNLFNNSIGVLLLIFARDSLRLDPATAVGAFGVAASLGSIGGLVGAAYTGRITNRLGLGPTMILGEFIASSGLLFLAYDTPVLAVPILGLFSPLLIFFFLFTISGSIMYDVNQVSLRQSIVPLKLQGRMNASIRWLIWGTIPIGSVLGGLLAQSVGVGEAVAISAFGGLLAGVWVLIGPARHLRTMPKSSETVVRLDLTDSNRPAN